jgi:large subunit ribosomal protein L19
MQTQDFKIGDTIRISFKSTDEKSKAPSFEGIVIAIRGEGGSKTFTVRKISSAHVAVERIFPFDSPAIEKIKVIKTGKVRRAKLYYLRKQ